MSLLSYPVALLVKLQSLQLQACRRVIELLPEDARSYAAHMVIHSTRGQMHQKLQVLGSNVSVLLGREDHPVARVLAGLQYVQEVSNAALHGSAELHVAHALGVIPGLRPAAIFEDAAYVSQRTSQGIEATSSGRYAALLMDPLSISSALEACRSGQVQIQNPEEQAWT